jgi:hypothetical protein
MAGSLFLARRIDECGHVHESGSGGLEFRRDLR